ncbi:MAG: bifunctional 5,10-methylene-tetrahydrofolate dehydrogenase/5,10-methylene-tetrahydrofolate cyclohydrolase [Coriobacteriales bacterium]|jgi:methylenetetrahydrofolate dehydrogenase (NADP+)/methenyltetrahydrofolate cyclohydrolase|nr:bifunctional 5,10-methylene-tetrahydrofolate dehydrogenase/5,10-methylene-tetrahydrofolate cyclohydrolase [Coriobacteriales bacterium]
MTEILRGAEVVKALNERVAAGVEELRVRDIVPTLAIVRVGERADDVSYERGASKRATSLGVEVRSIVLVQEVSTEALVAQIEALNADDAVHGVLVFRPLPAHVDEDVVRNALVPAKDIDGITDLSLAGVFTDVPLGFAPCTAVACVEILDHFGIDIGGKKVVVVGRSLVIGKPVAMMLLGRNATVTIAHSRTRELAEVVAAADIVIAAVGRANMLTERYLRQGQTVIDVGINVSEDGALVGDVDFAAASQLVAALTPVPGGVGTVTTSVLVKHVVEAAARQAAALPVR